MSLYDRMTPVDRAAVASRRWALEERAQVTACVLPASPMMAELEKAWAQIEILSTSLDRANKDFSDCKAQWELQQRTERQWWVLQLCAIKEQCLKLDATAKTERDDRSGDLHATRRLAARLDATTDELLRRGRELVVTQQHIADLGGEHQQLAFALKQTEEMRQEQQTERSVLVKELHDLEQRYESVKKAAKDSVPSIEAERALIFVATLWNAAGRQAPSDATQEQRSNRSDEVLNAWRTYFCRDSKIEAPLLRPTNNLILEPLRLVAGSRIAEVMLHQQPSHDGAHLAVVASEIAPPRLRMPGGPPKAL